MRGLDYERQRCAKSLGCGGLSHRRWVRLRSAVRRGRWVVNPSSGVQSRHFRSKLLDQRIECAYDPFELINPLR